MNTLAASNIDDVRAEIMRLENADHFDAEAWSRVLADLSAAGREFGLADARRRMETAQANKLTLSPVVVLERDNRLLLLPERVAAETMEA